MKSLVFSTDKAYQKLGANQQNFQNWTDDMQNQQTKTTEEIHPLSEIAWVSQSLIIFRCRNACTQKKTFIFGNSPCDFVIQTYCSI